MQKKQVIITPRSIQLDTAVNAFPADAAYNILNLRLNTIGENTTYSLSNELGNTVVQKTITTKDNTLKITGIIHSIIYPELEENVTYSDYKVIGALNIKDTLVLFLHNKNIELSGIAVYKDFIIKTNFKDINSILYAGNLNFKNENPIESIGIYENENTLKVYWVDGINLPRIININEQYYSGEIKKYFDNTVFDFNPSVGPDIITLNISVVEASNGNFPAGVILYAASYYNKLGQLSGLIYHSPLYYTSDNGRGLNPDGSLKSSLAFKIEVTSKSQSFQYVKIYRLVRTSIEGTPEATEISEVKVPSNKTVIYDNGTIGTPIDASSLFFLGGDTIKAGTISHKDNTLFLGNINNEATFISLEIKDEIKIKSTVKFNLSGTKTFDISELNDGWPYVSNLTKGSNDVTFFLKGERYRIGVLFLHKTGKWSESIWLGDYDNNVRVIPNKYKDGIYLKPIIDASVDINSLNTKEYIAARLVCVYPTINDRNVLCQGLICPTVYNIEDRNDNSPYVLSSWFARPKLFYKPLPLNYNEDNNLYKGSILYSYMTDINASKEGNKDIVTSLPDNTLFNSEIFCSSRPDKFASDIKKYYKLFGVDERIVTMHSPELDMAFTDELYNTSLSGIKFRVVGFATVKDTLSDIMVTAGNRFVPSLSNMYYTNINDPSREGHLSSKSLVNFPFWVDGIALSNDENYPAKPKGNYSIASFPIYPWHRKGSLSNLGATVTTDNRKSILQSKTMSNLRVCLPTAYLETYGDSIAKTDKPFNLEISNIELFNEDFITNKRINAWGLDLIYRGNIDRVITYKGEVTTSELGPDGPIEFKTDESKIVVSNVVALSDFNSVDIKSLLMPRGDVSDPNKRYIDIKPGIPGLENASIDDVNILNYDPIPILYKSTSHAVFAFKKDESDKYVIMPSIIEDIVSLEREPINENFVYDYNQGDSKLFWLSNNERGNFTGLRQDIIKINNPYLESVYKNLLFDASYFLIGELYRDSDTITNRFGGDTPEALLSNTWVVCGEPVKISTSDIRAGYINLLGTLGDTFLGRCDHLKTYPYAQDNVNNIVDIVSFVCETRINVDGRYDKNRGKKNNLFVNPTNFNLFNKVYSLRNNFFNYPYIDSNKLNITSFPNLVVWSRPKTLGENIDTWTSINTINSIDLDGDKGELLSLNRLNNEIYAFQDKGISRILYNSRAMITPSDGVPIEIANGGKVEGKVYINDNYGCLNKWSIAEVPSGIYFADNVTNGLYLFNGSLVLNISDARGMYSWAKNNITSDKWNPVDCKNIRTLYDSTTGDVYFTTDKEALAFNEKMLAFTSFYSYDNVSWLFNLNDLAYQINNSVDDKIWSMHTNTERCNFFNIKKPYSLLIIANPDFQYDKIIDTIEFRTNDIALYPTSKFKLNGNKKADYYPFLTIEVSNEYLEGKGDISTLKKKFRTWRWLIPRNSKDNKYTRDRIRNPWASIKMTLDSTNSSTELLLYDIVLDYYI